MALNCLQLLLQVDWLLYSHVPYDASPVAVYCTLPLLGSFLHLRGSGPRVLHSFFALRLALLIQQTGSLALLRTPGFSPKQLLDCLVLLPHVEVLVIFQVK